VEDFQQVQEREKQRKPCNEQSERRKKRKGSETLHYMNPLLGFPVYFLDSFAHTLPYVNPVPGFPAWFLDS
jgi:hypothetical protein